MATKKFEQSEATIVRGILGRLRKIGGLWLKIHGGPYQDAGIPDIIGCLSLRITEEMVGKTVGVFVGFEVKRPSKRGNTSERQEAMLGKIEHARGLAAVICSQGEAADELAKFFKKLQQNT